MFLIGSSICTWFLQGLFSDLLAALKRNAHFWRPVLESGTRTDVQNKGLGRMAGGGGREEGGLGMIIDERG